MLKTLLLTLATLLVFQQVFSATDEEVQQAYQDLYNFTNDIARNLQVIRDNHSASFLESLALQRLDGKLALNAGADAAILKINTLAERTDGFDNINVIECTTSLSDQVLAYRDQMLRNIEECLYDIRYETAMNLVSARWGDIVHLGQDYLLCTKKAIEDCKGDAACGDLIIAEIEQKKLDVANTLNLFGVKMINVLDGFPVKCTQQVLTEFNDEIDNIVEYVSSCIDRIISSFVPLMCQTSAK